VETGVQGSCNYLKELDSGFRRNDENGQFQAFYEIIKSPPPPVEKGGWWDFSR
jgi:hypothetical protein